MNICKKSLLASTIAAVISPLASADSTTLDTVVVSATRSEQSNITTPSSITIIRQEEIQASGASHIVDILRGRGGIQINDLYGDGSRASIGMRGFSGDTAGANTLILVDGRRLNNPTLSDPDLNSIALDNIERIEIIQGSAGTLFGDQAVAGVINIITKKIEGTSGNIGVDFSSYDSTRFRSSITHRDKNGLGVRFNIENVNSNGYRDNNELDNENYFGIIDYQHTNGSVFLEHQVIYEELNLPGDISEAQVDADRRQSNGFGDYANADTTVTRLGVHQAVSDNWDVEAEYTRRLSQSTAFFGQFSSFFISEIEVKEFTPRLIGFIPSASGDIQVTTGMDLIQSHYQTNFGGDDDHKVKSIYGQTVIPLNSKTNLTVGARHSKIDSVNDDSLNAAEIGISHQYTPEIRLFARIDQNFRFALIDEDTFTATTVDNLKPQEGNSYEVGAEWQQNGYSAKAVVYHLDLKNEIDFDPNATGPSSIFGFDGANVNLDPTERNGLILEGRYQLTPKLSLSGQYSYTDAEFTKGIYDGNEIPFAAEHTASLIANYDINTNWGLFGELLYTGDRVQAGDFDNANEELDGYTVANIAAHYTRSNLKVSARINNLFDKEYSDYAASNGFYPAPERNASLTVQYTY